MSETIVITEQSAIVVSGLLGVKGDTGDITPQLEQLRSDVLADKNVSQTSASTATAQAEIAAQQAGIATTAANTATAQANLAIETAETVIEQTNELVLSASASATVATAQAEAAAASAEVALASQQAIVASAATASTQAGIATTQAASAGASAAAANTTKDTVNALLTTFRQVFLGSFVSDAQAISFAATNNIPITDGIMYQDSVADKFRIYNGTAWQDYDSSAQASQSAAALSAANAGASAGTAGAAATSATTAANTATTKAGEASVSAAAALSSQTSASDSAASAAASAGTAGTAATTAVTQAGVATIAANTATTAANTATTQAGVATSAATTATTQAAIASASAASASQVAADVNTLAANLDLTGVAAQALHRSPNAVTAMFVYDTSKDSDGGAWTERCQHTSWYNEALMGKWLGAHESEFQARNQGATISATELLLNGSFDTDTTSWSSYSGATLAWEAGRLKLTSVLAGDATYGATQSITTTVGKTYRISLTAQSQATVYIRLGNTAGGFTNGNFVVIPRGAETFTFYFTATVTGTVLTLQGSADATSFFDNISVREVTALTTASGDYYQSTVDGKFYRLWKNWYKNSENINAANWRVLSGSLTQGQSDAFNGSTGSLLSITSGSSAGFDDYPMNYGSHGNEAQVFSIYVKAPSTDAASTISIILAGGGTTTFNLSTGQVTSGTGQSTATGNGWYRISWTSTKSNIYWYWGISISGSIGQGVIVSFIQLESGTTPTTYEAKTADGSITETFRGNKADFPRLSAIVAESNNVGLNRIAIYDLTESGRPMWMSATSVTNNYGFFPFIPGVNGVPPTSVSALNGIVAIGFSGVADRYGFLRVLRFPLDAMQSYSNGSNRVSSAGISKRNTTEVGFTIENAPPGSATPGIVNGMVNAVAMTVLPDAPVDAVTGLQVPTIAVATAGGVSVIKHNGTVVNSVAGNYTGVTIAGENLFTAGSGSAIAFVPGIKSLANNFATPSLPSYFWASWWNNVRISSRSGVAIVQNLSGSGPNKSVKFAKNSEISFARATTSEIANTYNTGHLIGDIRRAYLSDVDVGSVTGPELVTSTDPLSVTGPTGLSQGRIAFEGRVKVVIDATITPGNRIRLLTRNYNNTAYADPGGYITATGVYIFYGIAVNGGLAFEFAADPGGGTINSISIKKIVDDRSYKAKAADITGTLTKTQVAAAAQLVAYSGFSAANYIREPWSADLDFGVGEWSCSAWVNVPVTLPAGSFPAIGPELVTNGDFSASDLTGYSFNRATGVVTGGQLIVTRTSADSQYGVNAPCNIQAGRVYVVRFDFVQQTGGGAIEVYVGSGASQLVASNISAPSSFVDFFTAASSQTSIYIRRSGSGTVGETLTLDSISVREASPAFIFDRAHSFGPKVNLGVTPAGYLTATASDGTTTRTVTTTAAYNTATWIKPEAVYTTDGTLAIRVNGVEVAAARGTPLLTLNNASAVLTIGNSYDTTAPFPGSIALLKLSATVPTSEQSQWMYEQEKQMFREGAQVCLPDAGNVVDLAYDDLTDRWLAVSATNESEWSGLVRTSVTASPAGSYSKISASSGVQLQARTTTNPGVDVTIPTIGLREELVNRSQAAARLARGLVSFDYVGGFTANTTAGSTAISNAAGITYATSYVGARVSGTGIPADTFVAAISATTVYLTKAATATSAGVQISFSDFILPVGYEAKTVLLAGVSQREGATQAFVRLFDGFKETVRFNTAPSNTAFVQIQATRSTQ